MDELGSAHSFAFANVGEGGSIDYTEMNKGVTPIFFVEPIPDEKATEESGSVRMREQEVVRIVVAGDMLNVATSPVTDAIKERFAIQYAAWQTKRQDLHIDGTPLKNWPMIPAIRVAEFSAAGVFSVENLAAVSDTNIHKLADGRVWREKAKAWLDSAKEHGAASKYAAENERLRSQVDDMQRQINELAAQVSASKDEGGSRRRSRDAA